MSITFLLRLLTVYVGPQPGFVTRGDARGHGPRKGKWTVYYVVVVGEGECTFLLLCFKRFCFTRKVTQRQTPDSVTGDSASASGALPLGLRHFLVSLSVAPRRSAYREASALCAPEPPRTRGGPRGVDARR